MFKNFRDKITLSGIVVLVIGVALLIFTFISAYGFLTQSLKIIASEDLVQTFGEALAPLIATCIRIMYLGVMGWIGSLLTIRGVTIIAHAPRMPAVVPKKQTATKQKPPQKIETEQSKEEAKPSKPAIVFMPPEQVPQPRPKQKQPQENDSPKQSPNS